MAGFLLPRSQEWAEFDRAPLSDILPEYLSTSLARQWYGDALDENTADDEFSMADCCRNAHLRLKFSTFLLKATGLFLIFVRPNMQWDFIMYLAFWSCLVAIIIFLCWCEFWSLKEILPAWLWVHRRCGSTNYTSVPARFLKEWQNNDGTISNLAARWGLWVSLQILSSLSHYIAFLSHCESIGKVLKDPSKIRFPFFGMCILYLWTVGTNLQLLHALLNYSPSGERISHHPEGRRYERFNAWEPEWDRDRTAGTVLMDSRRIVALKKLEIRFCVWSNWLGRKVGLYNTWESTHYESAIVWSHALGARGIINTIPSSFHAEMAVFASRQEWTHYMRRAIAIVKHADWSVWLAVIPDRCLLLLYQSICILGTPLQTRTTQVTILSGLAVLLFSDSRFIWRVWRIRFDMERTASQHRAAFRGVQNQMRYPVQLLSLRVQALLLIIQFVAAVVMIRYAAQLASAGWQSFLDAWMFWLCIVFALLCLAGLLFLVGYKGRLLKEGYTFNIPGDDPDAAPINDPLLALREGRDNAIEIFPADQYQAHPEIPFRADEERQKLEAEKKSAEYERQRLKAERETFQAARKMAETNAAYAFQYMNPLSVGSALPATAPGAASLHAKEASVQAVEPDKLSDYLLSLDEGVDFGPPPGYLRGHGVLGHEPTNITVQCPALRVASRTGDDMVVYHYTHDAAFSAITGGKGLRNLRASFGERAHFGDGIYAATKSPGEFGSKEFILLNNYTNAVDPGKQEAQIQEWRLKGVVDNCIPLIVPRSMAINVMHKKTKEMKKPGYTARHFHPIRPDRDIIVIVLPEFATRLHETREAKLDQLASADFCVRLNAVEAFAQEAASGDQHATRVVMDMLNDPDHNIRAAAVWATACATSLSVREAKFKIKGLVDDPVKEVQCHVQEAFTFLDLAREEAEMQAKQSGRDQG